VAALGFRSLQGQGRGRASSKSLAIPVYRPGQPRFNPERGIPPIRLEYAASEF
jgi:hypothetical protein